MSMSALTLIVLGVFEAPLSIYTPIAESRSLGVSSLDSKSFALA